MIDVHIVNQKKQRKYIDSYNMEEKKMIDMHTVKKKKVHRFLRTRCKKKKKIQSTNHLNFSSHLILILCIEYIHIFIISRLRDFFFCFFIL